MILINRLIFFSIFAVLVISCSNNKPADYNALKQKALEIPPDFQLEPPVEGEEEILSIQTSNETEDIQSILEDSTVNDSESDSNIDKDMNLEEFVEEIFLKKQ